MDLNGDGCIDLLSGSWPGEIFLFRGGPGHTFAAPEMLRHQDGTPINIGGGIEEDSEFKILISGTVEIDRSGEQQRVTFGGKTIEVPKEKAIWTTGTASASHAADWDGDGDLDLIVGDITGAVHLVPNEGTAKEPVFGEAAQLEAGGRPLGVSGDAGPFVIDWDGDGDLDLLVGDGSGAVQWFPNEGTKQAPSLAQAVRLIGERETRYGTDAPTEPVRGIRSKVCAADWNGDGRLDLLVGDYTTQQPDLPAITAEEEAEQSRLRDEMGDLSRQFHKLYSEQDALSGEGAAERKKELDAEMEEVREHMSQVREKLRPEYESHGWVWLFLRRPDIRQA